MSMHSNRQPDVLIVGGGVVGAACAYALSEAGLRVVVLDDRARPPSASRASAGMLAPMVEASPDDPLTDAAVRSRDLTIELVRALEADTGARIKLQTEGIYHARFTAEEADATRAVVAWQQGQGYPTTWLDAEDLRARLPGISPDVVGAAYAPDDASLDPGRFVDALLAAARARGASVRRRDPASELLLRQGRAVGARTAAAPARGVRAGAVVIAGGCWSGGLRGLPRPLPVEPVRGQMVRHRWPRAVPPAVVFGTGGYVVHRGGEAFVGSTMERAGFAPSVTPEGLRHIAAVGARIFPALADRTPTDSWAGLRPMAPDGHPIVGPDPDVEGLWYATGHGRNGILFATLTAHVIRDGILQQAIDPQLGPLDPARLWA